MHRPIHHPSFTVDDSNISHKPPLPLTKENLMSFQGTIMDDQKDSPLTNEILARYCHEILLNNMEKGPVREQCEPTSPTHIQKDVVVVSPRVLPFPYHNDSMFLPTAEQVQYHHLHSSAMASSSSSATDSGFFISRSQSTTHIQNSSSSHSFTTASTSKCRPERRSLPAKFDYSNIIISKNNKKSRVLYRNFTFSSCSTTSLSQHLPIQETKKPWLKRILKFFNKHKHNRKQKNKNAAINEGTIHQVWYCQYSKNPATRFGKYYHHQAQQPIISVA